MTLEHLIIVIGLFLWLRSLMAYFQAQRSLQWWHRSQVMKLRHEAEELRNGLLQETFALRRNLEISLAAFGQSSDYTDLQQLEKVYSALKDLSDRLSPPYIDESLPHAIQYWLQEWQSRYPAIAMTTTFPDDWILDRYEHHRVILMMLDELFNLSLATEPAPESISLRLWQQHHQAHLTIQLSHPASASNSAFAPSHLHDFQTIFRFLINGTCTCRSSDSARCWHFSWQLPES